MIFNYFLIIVFTFSSVFCSFANEIPEEILPHLSEKKEDQKEIEQTPQKKNPLHRTVRHAKGASLYDAFTKEDLETVMHLVENNVEIQEAINHAIQKGDNVNAQKLLFLDEFSKAVLNNYQTQEEKKRWMSVTAERVSIAGIFITGIAATAYITQRFCTNP